MESGRELEKAEVPYLLERIYEKYDFTKGIENAFSKCDLCPFNPDAPDGSKCTKLVEKEAAPLGSEVVVGLQNFMQHFKASISSDVLEQFQRTYTSGFQWLEESKRSLYETWCNLIDDNVSYSVLQIDLSSRASNKVKSVPVIKQII